MCHISPSRTDVTRHKMLVSAAAGPALAQPTVRLFVSSPKVEEAC